MNNKTIGDKAAEAAGGFLKAVGIAMLVLWLLLCLVLFAVFGLGFNHYLNRVEKENVSLMVYSENEIREFICTSI
ncbi:MAG: hypothetical protein IJA90_11175 [Peptococcaceae bacterium]|nr:hypothetical protein [Peptococcaceae bacterium]